MKLRRKCLTFLMFFLMMVCFNGTVVKAAASQPKLEWAKELNASSIAVKWTGNPSEDEMYVIFRKTDGQPYKMINAVIADYKAEYAYVDSPVVPNQKYTYTVRSVPSEKIEPRPVQIGTLSSGSQVQCFASWEKSKEKDLTAYVIDFNKGNLHNTDIINKKYNTVKYYLQSEDEDVIVNVYGLLKGGWSSYDKKGVSAKTTINKVSVKDPVVVGNGTVKLTWTQSKGATGYNIYRKTGNGKWKKVQTVDSGDALYGYDDTVKKGNQYQYKVKAFVSDGKKTVESSDSNITRKVNFSSVAREPSKKLYKAGNQYMSGLSSKEIKDVQNVAKKFYQTYITDDMTEVEKLIAAQAYLAATCVYGTGGKFYNAWGALVYKNKQGYHEASCYGYSYALQALCASAGLECKIVRPNSKATNPNHMWTMVKVEKKWYIVDPQPNANYGIFTYFLLSGKTYVQMTGETFDTKVYSGISGKDYSRKKLMQYASGYKVQRVMKKMKLTK